LSHRFDSHTLPPNLCPNDVVLGPDGALYFTDPTLDLPQGQTQEIPFQDVYRLGLDGLRVTLLTRELTQPNGLAFSPDGKHFYVDDSERRNIRVYDFHTDETMSNGRRFGEEPGGKDDGVPDGMIVDEGGNIFDTGPRDICVWDKTEQHLGTIVTPEQPANLNWGRSRLRHAAHHRHHVGVSAAHEDARLCAIPSVFQR
jgi:gluconolactonase